MSLEYLSKTITRDMAMAAPLPGLSEPFINYVPLTTSSYPYPEWRDVRPGRSFATIIMPYFIEKSGDSFIANVYYRHTEADAVASHVVHLDVPRTAMAGMAFLRGVGIAAFISYPEKETHHPRVKLHEVLGIQHPTGTVPGAKVSYDFQLKEEGYVQGIVTQPLTFDSGAERELQLREYAALHGTAPIPSFSSYAQGSFKMRLNHGDEISIIDAARASMQDLRLVRLWHEPKIKNQTLPYAPQAGDFLRVYADPSPDGEVFYLSGASIYKPIPSECDF